MHHSTKEAMGLIWCTESPLVNFCFPDHQHLKLFGFASSCSGFPGTMSSFQKNNAAGMTAGQHSSAGNASRPRPVVVRRPAAPSPPVQSAAEPSFSGRPASTVVQFQSNNAAATVSPAPALTVSQGGCLVVVMTRRLNASFLSSQGVLTPLASLRRTACRVPFLAGAKRDKTLSWAGAGIYFFWQVRCSFERC